MMMMFLPSEKPLLVSFSRNFIFFPHDITKNGENFFDGGCYEIVVLFYQELSAFHLNILNQPFKILHLSAFLIEIDQKHYSTAGYLTSLLASFSSTFFCFCSEGGYSPSISF